ncbi:MAG: DegT/DnrJ/EryC1/StrS aminotransferase family protein [Ferruginibacter sp.]|nr:DegT/DnrJ/EryC1/StrS aminotransferase family protein [Ferruginibacter sp.]
METTNLNKQFPLMIPYITPDDIAAVTEVLQSGMLIQGKHVGLLENKIRQIANVKEAVAVSNGTATLHLALISLGIGKGDEVIVPAFSYVATANVVELVGATPVFVDIDSDTFNIDVSKIKAVITEKTKAIIPVHEFGLACNISEVISIALTNKIHVIEDAACALGAKENEQPVGSFGIVASFSLHPRKSVTSGEGGIITTNNQELAAKFRALRNHGIDSENTDSMEFILAGYNYRLTDFQAAFVNSQLERFDQILTQKQMLADVYLNELDASVMKLPVVPDGKNHTWQTFHVVLEEKINRAQLIAALKERGIGSNYGAQCIPATKYYQEKYGFNNKASFPYAYRAYTSGLALPLYYGLTKEDVKYIATEINKSIKNDL